MTYFISQQTRTLRIVLILIFCMSLFHSSAFATQAEGEKQNLGWVEVQATVPDGFQEDLSIILQAEDGSATTIYILPDNGYIGRAEVAFGTYDVMSAGVVGDTKMRYPTDWSPYLIEVTNADAAVKITVDVTAAEGYSPIVSMNSESGTPIDSETTISNSEGPSDSSSVEVNTGEASSSSNNTHQSTESRIGEEGETPQNAEESQSNIGKVLRTLSISLAGIAAFVCIICAVVYCVRKRDF